MAEVAYVVIELPDLDEAAVRFTESHPEVVIDQVVWRGPDDFGGTNYQITALARHVPPGRIDELIAELHLAKRLKTHRRDDEEGVWLGSFAIPSERLESPASVAVNEFTQRHGLQARWLRIEHGTLYAKCEVPRGADPQQLADQLRGFIEAKGIDADIGVEVTVRGQFSPWDELIEEIVDEIGFSLPSGFGS